MAAGMPLMAARPLPLIESGGGDYGSVSYTQRLYIYRRFLGGCWPAAAFGEHEQKVKLIPGCRVPRRAYYRRAALISRQKGDSDGIRHAMLTLAALYAAECFRKWKFTFLRHLFRGKYSRLFSLDLILAAKVATYYYKEAGRLAAARWPARLRYEFREIANATMDAGAGR